jgi:thymidylate kinase
MLCLRQKKAEVDSPVGKSAKLNAQLTASQRKQKREAIGEKATKPEQKILSSIFLIATAATIGAQVAKGGTDYQSVAEINDVATITLDPDKTLSHAEPGKEKILRQVLLNWRF